MSDDVGDEIPADNPFSGLEPIKEGPISPALMVGAIALNMAMKYADMSMVKDGTLYQQYKIEGRNLNPIKLEWVFSLAREIEMHLMGTSNRLSCMVIEAVMDLAEEDEIPSENSNA